MTRALILTGKKFNKLLVTARAANSKTGQTRWHCLCDCGTELICYGSHITSNHTKSCGCLNSANLKTRNYVHGQAHRGRQSRAYKAWKEMKRRVLRDPSYTAKGIFVCDEWANSYDTFYKDMGDCPDNYELDRVNNADGYHVGNCRWVSEVTQSRNRGYCKLDIHKARSIRLDQRSASSIAKDYGVSKSTILRIKQNRSWCDA